MINNGRAVAPCKIFLRRFAQILLFCLLLDIIESEPNRTDKQNHEQKKEQICFLLHELISFYLLNKGRDNPSFI